MRTSISSSSCDDFNRLNSTNQTPKKSYADYITTANSSMSSLLHGTSSTTSLLQSSTTAVDSSPCSKLTTSSPLLLSSGLPSPTQVSSPLQSSSFTRLRNDNLNDLSASAASTIQLNQTDNFTTQVDYYLNEASTDFSIYYLFIYFSMHFKTQ